MINKFLISPSRKWIKRKIRNSIIEYDNQRISETGSQILYFPKDGNAESYIVKSETESQEVCQQGLPVPPRELWLGYGKTVPEYLNGITQIKNMTEILKRSGYEISEAKRILDFGCGAGRMIRWLKPYSDSCEIWGSDISSAHIIWANKHLKPPFNFLMNTTIPHMPFEDRYFDLIYAGSVFTHIDDLTEAWLLELRRILSPEGKLYITIHDKHTIDLLGQKKIWVEGFLNKLLQSNSLYKEYGKKFDVLSLQRGPASQVFYDVDFFTKSVSNIFEVLSVTPEAYGYQTGILLKKK